MNSLLLIFRIFPVLWAWPWDNAQISARSLNRNSFNIISER